MMANTLNNIDIPANTQVEIYSLSKIPLGTPIKITLLSTNNVKVTFGLKPDARANPSFGYELLNQRNTSVRGASSDGCWLESSFDSVVNVKISTKSSGQSGGRDGVTPHIGQNGNWFIGTTDTGVNASGNIAPAVTHVALTGNQLVFTHGDGAKHAINLPVPSAPSAPSGLTKQIQQLETQMQQQGVDVSALKTQVGDLSHSIHDLKDTFSYSGTTPPGYPSSKKSAYFINLHNSPSSLIQETLPDVSLDDGTVYFLNNGNTSAKITLRPQTGRSIANGDHIDVEPQNFLMLVKNGTNWVTASQGYIPSGFDDLVNRVAQKLAGQLHTSDQINQMINNWLANPSTKAALDKILTSLGYEKKTQPQPHPSAIVVHLGTAQDFPSSFSGEIGHYAPHQSLVVNNLDQNPAKIWVAVPSSQSSKITGVVVNNGLPAIWNSKEITVQGEKWTVFISPYQMHEQHINIALNWSV